MGFVNRNLVLLVMLPSLVALHWSWWKLQQVDEFVPPEERKAFPIIDATKRIALEVKKKFISPEDGEKSEE